MDLCRSGILIEFNVCQSASDNHASDEGNQLVGDVRTLMWPKEMDAIGACKEQDVVVISR